ncbi:MAG: DUF3379 family protein [Xanthomonadales bacterium]|nr:DUF3379 family protein [Xanthomonadales bacterium]
MNCLEFRRAIGTDPRGLDAAALAHRAQCPRCSEAHERALVFERSLAAAIAIPVPDTLAERILLHQTTAALHEPRVRSLRIWQIAAGLVVGIGLATAVGWRVFTANAATTDLAVAHLAHEPFALSARAEVASADVRAMFASLGAPIAHSPGAVHYLNDCPLGSRMSVHMVMQRASGPVTAMYVPKLREARRDFDRAGVRGREATIGDGTLILLAADAREFDAIESQFHLAFAHGIGSAVGAP